MRNLFTLTLLCSHLFLTAIEEADLIISSNKVILMTEKESAQPLSVAIKNKKIIWIGSHEDAKNIQGEHVDFGNQAVLPGFIDAHGHASYLAFATQVANIASPPVGKINNIQDLQTELKNFIQDSGLQPGEWLMGLGYDDSLLAEQRHPRREYKLVSGFGPQVKSTMQSFPSPSFTKGSRDVEGEKVRCRGTFRPILLELTRERPPHLRPRSCTYPRSTRR